jgi:hypothetical protein
LSGNLAEHVADAESDEDRCYRTAADELRQLILRVCCLVNRSLNRFTGVRDAPLWSITHVQAPPFYLLRAEEFAGRSRPHRLPEFGSANRAAASPGDVDDHDDQENHEEDVEQKLRDSRSRAGNATEAEKACDKGNDKGDESIV